MKLSPVSAAVGAAATLGLFLLVGLQTATSGPSRTLPVGTLGVTIDGPVEVEGIPSWEDFATVLSGTPYPVPAAKVFVPTGLVRVSGGGADVIDVTLDATTVLHVNLVEQSHTGFSDNTVGSNVVEIPPGIHATEGVVVDLVGGDDGSGAYKLLGYLADA